METTFEKFINNNVKQKALFDKEYAEFSRSERMLENLEIDKVKNSPYVGLYFLCKQRVI